MSDKRFQKKLARIKRRGEHWKQEKELKAMYEEYMPEKKKPADTEYPVLQNQCV